MSSVICDISFLLFFLFCVVISCYVRTAYIVRPAHHSLPLPVSPVTHSPVIYTRAARSMKPLPRNAPRL